ncbi:PEP-CTERM sorting domain-containing protein [Gemmatimonas sp.]|jgi:hypothetical protein|uniref:PEP-CTERM sorting domain-containing protein n=1 Tax=Gemmatimonas sp. TaxID=1962908 RepID=UPI0037BF700D
MVLKRREEELPSSLSGAPRKVTMKKYSMALGAAIALAGVTPQAQAQSVTSLPGTTYYTNGPINDDINVNQLGGLSLTAYWGSFSETYLLNGTGGWGWNEGGNLSLTASGTSNTYFAFWSLNNTRDARLTRLVFDGAATNVVFDRGSLLGPTGTPGSNVGYDLDACRTTFTFLFTFCGADQWNTQVLYTNQVAVNPDLPVGDLFRTIDVTFGNDGIDARRSVDAFIRFDTDLSDTPVVVPEPSTYALMGAGLLGVVGFARRRNRNT